MNDIVNKSSFLLLTILLFSTSCLKAQNQPFKPGDMILGVFQGMGGKMGVTDYDYLSKAKGIVVDNGLSIPMDSGFFGLGFSYSTRNQSYYKLYNNSTATQQYYLQYNWNYTMLGTRITYHIDLLGVPCFDTYVGATITYVKVQFIPFDNLYSPFPPYINAPGYTGLANKYQEGQVSYPNFFKYGVLVGARYDIFNFLGIFGEANAGAPFYFNFGASLKL